MKLPIASITIAASCVKANDEIDRHGDSPIKSIATSGKVFLESDSDGGLSCEANINDGCWTDADCCEMECLGIIPWNYSCGNTPGTEGEYCNLYYACDEDLVCHEGECTAYADLLVQGTQETCKEGSPTGELKVMTYNLFLLNCVDALGDLNPHPCQEPAVKESRIVPNLFSWFEQSDTDVVMFQEVWSLRAEIIDGMTRAGFCHYVASVYERTGSGLMIFSKYPLENADFVDYYDPTGENSDMVLDPEAIFSDRGIMYAKVTKDGKNYHVANTHTLSSSLMVIGIDNHENRMAQYQTMRLFVESKNIPTDEMVLYGGDMNEDKYNGMYSRYEAMIGELDAFEPEHPEGSQQFSYDTLKNPIPASFQDDDYEELLDYVLVSNNHGQPEESTCEVLIPQWPVDCGGEFECMLSDHFPVVCTFIG